MNKTPLKPTADHITLIEPIAETAKKIRYAAYVRVSSGSTEQLQSYAQQISHYIRLFQENKDKWHLVDIYADEAITGTSLTKREDFNRLLTDCRLGKIDRIITKSVSRFSRDNIVTLATIRELSALGITVFFEDDNIDTLSMSSEFILSLQGLVAQQGSQTISANMRKGFQIRASQGKYTPTKKPYGYNIDQQELVINNYEASIVKQIFTEYLSGSSMTSIARSLTAKGISSPAGKAIWHCSSVKHILINERIIGDTKLQKKFSTDSLPIQKKVNKGERDMYYIKDTHQPIIDRKSFAKVQLMIEQRSQNKAEQLANHHFNKMIRCGECGRVLRRKVIGQNAYWTCHGRDKGDSKCSIAQIPEQALENAFIEMLNRLKNGKDRILLPMLNMLIELRAIKNQSNEQLIKLAKQIQEIHEQSHVLNGLRSKGIIDSAFCLSGQNDLNSKLSKLKKARDQVLMSEENDHSLVQTKLLISHIDDCQQQVRTFDTLVFKGIVDKIKAVSAEEIIFSLINGLEINARVLGNGDKN